MLKEALNQIKGPVTRQNLRDALETIKMCGANGCRQVRPDDHRGLTANALEVMQIRNGNFAALAEGK